MKLSIPLGLIVGSFAISRLIVFGVLIASAYSQAVPVDGEGRLKAAFLQWDARWYERLSETGYQESHEVAFFPAFIVASRALRAVGLDFAVASILMNNVFLLLSGVLLFLLARPLTDRTSACMAVLILFFHPLSFYFSVPYTESLLLVSVLSGFYLVSSGRYQVGGLPLAVAALTRNTGIFAAPALALQRPLTRKWKFWLWTIGPSLAAVCGFMTYCELRFDNPFQFISAQEYWRDHIRLDIPFRSFLWSVFQGRSYSDHNFLLSLLGLVLGIQAAKVLPVHYAAFIVPQLLLSFSMNKLAITPRLHLVLFPLWITGGALLARQRLSVRWGIGIVAVCAMLHLMLRYVQGKWVA